MKSYLLYLASLCCCSLEEIKNFLLSSKTNCKKVFRLKVFVGVIAILEENPNTDKKELFHLREERNFLIREIYYDIQEIQWQKKQMQENLQ